MKSTIHQLQKNNFKIVGKNLIFTIGTVLLTFGSAVAETNGKTTTTIIRVDDSTNVKAETYLVGANTTNEEMIVADGQIIESENEAVAPLLPGKSSEEVVQDDAKIIEGVNATVYPLDFKKINREKKTIKLNNKRLIGSL